MSAATDLRALLVAAPAVSALVAQRVRANRAEQGDALPYVVFTRTAVDRQKTLNGSIAGVLSTFELQCWAATSAEAEALGDAVQAVLETNFMAVTGRSDGYDSELDLEASVLIVDWWD